MLAALQAWFMQIIWVGLVDWVLVLLLLGISLFLTRHSRSAILLRGFLCLLLLYLLTGSLPLLHSVLDKLLVGISVAMGLFFQPELRRLLEYLGRDAWLVGKPHPTAPEPGEAEDHLEELVQAVRELSQNRTGALIVLEVDETIDQRVFTDQGVPLNAHLSRELLQTIFQTSTLLHDGAVVIQQNRIKAAGVILPVSDRVASRQLGTRHRAAMGISEQSNCLCIVVSEETGSISLAEDGRLERPLTSSKLKELLMARLHPHRPSRSDVALQRLWPDLLAKLSRRFSGSWSSLSQKTLPKE